MGWKYKVIEYLGNILNWAKTTNVRNLNSLHTHYVLTLRKLVGGYYRSRLL